MVILALQVHVLKDRKWSILKSFAPQDRSTAWSLYVSLARPMGYDGKKFVEEAVRDNGLLIANTVSFQVFDPEPGHRDPAAKDRAARAARGRRNDQIAPPRLSRRFRRGGPDRPKRGGVVESLFGFLKAYGEKLRGRRENVFRKTKTAAFSRFGDPERTRRFNSEVNARSDAYTTRYKDEEALSAEQLIRAESTEVLGTAFFTFVHDNLVSEALRGDARFRIGICCFVVSALIKIEAELELDSDRGRALLTDALEIFLLDEAAVETFIARMATFLSQPASARFIRAGARCFELYEIGDLDGVAERFRELFEHEAADRSALADSQEVAIFVVRVADPHRLREEYGNVGVQTAVDHMLRLLGELETEHGGRTLKSMGDCLMCAAHRPGAMVEIAVALLRSYKRGDDWKAVPPHDVCIGGGFGRAVLRDGDYFGEPVHTAASLAAVAAAGEACFPARLEHVASGAGAHEVRRTRVKAQGGKGDLPVLHVQ